MVVVSGRYATRSVVPSLKLLDIV